MRSTPEFELIERVRGILESKGAGPGSSLGIGDDAAVVDAGDGVLVTSVDSVVEGVHFGSSFSDEQIGHKALATALSDLAAMGARPEQAYVALLAPPELGSDRAGAIAAGIGALAAEHGVAVLGGDLSIARQLALVVTVVGRAAGAADLVTRSGASPGDVVLVSGELGGAAAGLALLEAPDLGRALEPALLEALRARQLEPTPRIELGLELAAAGAGAMIDISDGVVADAEQIASESGVRIELDAAALPVAAGVAEVAGAAGRDPLELAGGGEDFELLATIGPETAERLLSTPSPGRPALTAIGSVVEGSGVGAPPELGRGFDHLEAG